MTPIPRFTMSDTPLTGNEKRIASCKMVGGAKKRGGHALEHDHDALVGIVASTTSTKPEADCIISPENPLGAKLLEELTEKFGEPGLSNCSIKSGNNLQFVLGNIPEITEVESMDGRLSAMANPDLWWKYLGKSQSKKPANLLVYYDKGQDSWTYFKMADCIQFIVSKATWRGLATGRMKADFADKSSKGSRQYLTYEYRATHGSHFLGANGGRGGLFIQLLKANIPFLEKVFRR